MAEGLNIPFDIGGNAEKQLNAVSDAVKRVEDSIKQLNATIASGGVDKNLSDQSKKATRDISARSAAVKRSASVIKQQSDDTKALAAAEIKLAQELGRVTPLTKQKTAATKAALSAIQKQKVATEKLAILHKEETDSLGRSIRTFDAKRAAIDRIIRKQNEHKVAVEEARIAQEKQIATQKQLDLLAREAGLPTLRERQEQLKQLVQDQERHAKEAAKLEQARRRDEDRYERRRTTLLRRRRLAQRRREARWAREKQAELRREQAELRRVEAEQRRVERAQARINQRGNRAAFIFRRLFGILAAFTAARLALRGFFGGIEASVEFNKNIEQAQLGIASIFTATGNVRDAMGNAVDASEALALAQKEAQRQTKLLRRDALTTAATFDQLLDTFQIGLAPGIAAGLNIDEIRKFTLRISQAATAIGLAQNQLAEEIRSILSGTIQARTTRIAVALGITNEDIRRAKEYGRLFEFLEGRFRAFEQAGEKAMTTVAALTGRVRDAFLQLLGAAGEEFFEKIREGLQATFKTLTVETPEGFIEPSPEALRAFESIFDGLEAAADHARDLSKALELGDLEGVGAIIGQILDRGTEVLAGIIQGIVEAAGVIKDTLQTLGINLPTGELREIVASITKWVVLLITAKSTIGLITGTFGKFFGLVTKLGNPILKLVNGTSKIYQITDKILFSYGKLSSVLRVVTSRILGWGAIFGTLLLGVQQELQRLLDIDNLSIRDTVEILVESFIGGFKNIIADAKVLWIQFKDWLANSFAPEAVGTFKKIALGVTSVIPGLKEDSIKALEDIYKEEDRLAEQRAGRGEDSPAVKAAKAERDAIKQANADKLAALMNQKRIEKDEDQKNFGEKLKQFEKEKEAANAFIDVLSEIPLVVGQGTQALTVQADIIQKLKDDLEELQLRAATERVDLTGTAAQQAKLQVSAQKEIFTSLKQINLAIEEQQRRLEQIKQQKEDLKLRTSALREEEVLQISNIVAAGKTYFEISKEIRDADKEAALLKEGITAATERANFEEAKNLTAKRQIVLETKKAKELEKERAIEIGKAAVTGVDPKVIEFAQERLSLIGQEESILKDIEIATENRGNVEADILEKFREQIRLVQQAANLEASRTLPLKEAELKFQKSINDLRSSGLVRTLDIERREAEGRLSILRKELDIINEKTQANVDAAISTLEEAESAEQIAEAKENLNNIEKERLVLLGLQVEEIRKQLLLIDNIRKQQEEGIFSGFEQGLINFADRFSSEFQTGVQIAENAVQGLADFISTEIAEAFDPSTDQTWRQRLGMFLRDFSRMVLNELIKLAIAKAILGLAGGPTGAVGVSTVALGAIAAGGFKGGRIHRYADRMSHFGSYAQGLAKGGFPRPKGLHPSDTIPIWAAEGEYMHRRKAVRAYGLDVMDKINRIAINPFELRALATNTARISARTPKTPGFQEGGIISEVVGQTASEQRAGQTPAADLGQPLVGVVVADEETMGRLIDNGGGSLMRWVRSNASEISAALGR